MNWLNSNMHSDESSQSDTDSSQSDTDTKTIKTISNTDSHSISNINRYLCHICNKRTKNPIFNEIESCFQCPHCKRSWCLEDTWNKKKCHNLDLIKKRYLEIKFSKNQFNQRHNHHITKHTLSWIGMNILGNLGNIDDTLNEINTARIGLINTEETTLESLRAQQRFGIINPNINKYHATHPVIIGSLPKLDITQNKQLLLRHNVCPICQIKFIDGDETDHDIDELLLSENDENDENDENIKEIDKDNKKNKNKQDIDDEKEEEDMFKIMEKSRKEMNENRNRKKKKMMMNENKKHGQILNEQRSITKIVNLYDKQSENENENENEEDVDIGNELIASNVSNLRETMNITMNDNNNNNNNNNNNDDIERNNNLIVNEWNPGNNEEKIEENMDINNWNEEEDDDNNKELINCSLIVRLWCGHIFHSECVIAWLSKQNTCPLCRYELPSNNPSYELKRRIETYNNNNNNIYQVMT